MFGFEILSIFKNTNNFEWGLEILKLKILEDFESFDIFENDLFRKCMDFQKRKDFWAGIGNFETERKNRDIFETFWKWLVSKMYGLSKI